MEHNFWRISDFSRKIGKHMNTIDGWFKQLEERRIHYINRAGNEKVYDELDLSIGLFISKFRDQKMPIDVITEQLPSNFELRPFPINSEPSTELHVVPIETLKQQLLQEIRASVKEVTAVQIEEIKQALQQSAASQIESIQKNYEDILLQLPKPFNELEERQRRVTELLTRRRVENQLEKEALHLWASKSAKDRLRKAGLFRTEEDINKRDRFVKDYIDERFEVAIKREYGLD